jgi:hypothetical protein
MNEKVEFIKSYIDIFIIHNAACNDLSANSNASVMRWRPPAKRHFQALMIRIDIPLNYKCI